MSELLYMFGQIDARVMPLVFSVRRWALSVGITNPSPGRWISNFSLTCLVIFYLQHMSEPILPAINELVRQARRPADVCITENGVNCTFLRDLRLLQFSTSNAATLEQLLVDFFEFYSQIDFADRAISLNEGRLVSKPDHSPVYIVNPLEPQLNVSKNVSAEECERFRIEVRNAAWALDSYGARDVVAGGQQWGLLALMKQSQSQTVIRPTMFFKPRMVDVSELFDGAAADAADKKRAEIRQFKNDAVKKEVERIQRKGREDMQQLRVAAAAGAGEPKTTIVPKSALPSRGVRKR